LLCAVHCAASSILLALLPVWAGAFFGRRWEAAYVLAALALAAFTHVHGHRAHGRRAAIVVSSAAAVVLLGTMAFAGPPVHGALMGWGGLLLAAGHFLNRSFCRACRLCAMDHGRRCR
jgi:hypothetical protein